MKRQILACALAVASVLATGLQASQTSSALPLNFNLNLPSIAGMANLAQRGYGWMHEGIIKAPWIAHNPAVQNFVNKNFNMIMGLSALVTSLCAVWRVAKIIKNSQWYMRRHYNAWTPEQQKAFLATALNQLPSLLLNTRNTDQISSLMQSSGVPFRLGAPGWSQDILDVRVTGDTFSQLVVHVYNLLAAQQQEHHFVTPYNQSAIDPGLGIVATLLSKNPGLVDRIANALVDLPASTNYHMTENGTLMMPADKYQQALEETMQDAPALTRDEPVSIQKNPFFSLRFVSGKYPDNLEMLLTDNVSGRGCTYMLYPQRDDKLPSKNRKSRPTTIPDDVNTQSYPVTYLLPQWDAIARVVTADAIDHYSTEIQPLAHVILTNGQWRVIDGSAAASSANGAGPHVAATSGAPFGAGVGFDVPANPVVTPTSTNDQLRGAVASAAPTRDDGEGIGLDASTNPMAVPPVSLEHARMQYLYYAAIKGIAIPMAAPPTSLKHARKQYSYYAAIKGIKS
jgi:hypothetical protein